MPSKVSNNRLEWAVFSILPTGPKTAQISNSVSIAHCATYECIITLVGAATQASHIDSEFEKFIGISVDSLTKYV